ncbi:acyltransferase [Candidatus Marinimicrobia bacterium]|nr:acyltransferase [Candidatus Neomarinimicrobiota bacterium]
MEYRKEIDGLRAIAVLPVILFHAGFIFFKGGYVGVDIFFVISGYLITNIIISKLKNNNFSFYDFYLRRTRRILPVLFFVTMVTIPFSLALLTPGDQDNYAKSLIAIPLFITNIVFWRQSGYFDTGTELKPLIHTWSLAVEEQYYILFPLFLFLCWRVGKKFTLISLTLLFFASLYLAEWGNVNAQSATFYLLPTRGFELLIGVFCAFYFDKIPKLNLPNLLSEIFGILGMSMIILSILFFDKNTPVPGISILLPTVGTALIILFSTNGTLIAKLLGKKIFVFIGLISYSAYLWHQPLLAFLKYQYISEFPVFLKLMSLPVVLILSFFSWKYVETPFRKGFYLKNITQYILLFSIFIPIGFLILNTNFSKGNNINSSHLLNERRIYSENLKSNFNNKSSTILNKKYLIVGDSMWLDALNIISTIHPINYEVSQSGDCPPHDNINSINSESPNAIKRECSMTNKKRFNQNLDKFDGVIIISRYDWFKPHHLSPYLNFLKENGVKNIIVFGGYYSLDTRIDRLINFYGNNIKSENIEKHIINSNSFSNDEFYQLQNEFGFQYVSIKDSACYNNDCKYYFKYEPYTIDKHHLSLNFTKLIAQNNKRKILDFLNK